MPKLRFWPLESIFKIILAQAGGLSKVSQVTSNGQVYGASPFASTFSAVTGRPAMPTR